jgi:hypothetical protein
VYVIEPVARRFNRLEVEKDSNSHVKRPKVSDPERRSR